MPTVPKKRVIKTQQIPIKEEQEENHYELHIEQHSDPGKALKELAAMGAPGEKAAHQKQNASHVPHLPHLPVTSYLSAKRSEQSSSPTRSGLGIRLWNFLEWMAMSALVFMALFFVLNFGSYSQLIQSKLEKITGNFQVNPFIEKMVTGKDPATQELLPVAPSPGENVKQIPPVQLEVAPPDDRVIIPRINQNVPVVAVSTQNLLRRDWSALEGDIQEALKNGVVHYPGTAQPGDHGNVVITGHSSYFPWDPGRFKDVFALLHEVVVGDQIIVYHEQEKYLYEVYEKKVVSPDQIEVLTQSGDNKLTLITCTPVGTNLNRLIVVARPV